MCSRAFSSFHRKVCIPLPQHNWASVDLLGGNGPNGTISDRMVKSVERYPSETIVAVHALVRKAPKPVRNATIHHQELDIYEIHKISNLTENVPFTVYDAENINRDKEDVEDEDDTEDSTDTPEDTPRTSGDWQRHIKNGDPSTSK